MDFAAGIVALVAVAALGAWVADHFGLSEPLLLIAIGLVGGLLPFVPEVRLEPDLVLIGLLPPLLYATAIRTSVVSLKAEWPIILLLSVGLVVFTTFGVGLVVWWLLPVPFAAAVALGAVVAPPDAVAATAVARRVGMPRRLVTILEGESLLNDATALVALHTAIAAMEGSVTKLDVTWDFVLAAGGGALIGGAIAFALGFARRRITDPVLDTTLSFVAPFAAYLPAEHVHASGVVAAVVAGLVFGQRAYVWQRASSRVAERLNWRTVSFILENVVFLLIGLQVLQIVTDAWDAAWAEGLSTVDILLAVGAVLVAVIVLRAVWIMAWHPVIARLRPGNADRRVATVASWSGMRGVVTLAAVLVLPEETPLRDVLILAALVVVGGTLALQGTTLPWLMRRLGLRGPTPAEDALQVAALSQQGSAAGLRALDDLTSTAPAEVIEDLRDRVQRRTDALWERLGPSAATLETPSDQYRRLRLAMLDAERAEVLRLQAEGSCDHVVVGHVLSMLDVEETMIGRIGEDGDDIEGSLEAPRSVAGCDHLAAAQDDVDADTPGECQECLDAGMTWVHLRKCLACGHIACCDSSVGKHASAHFRASTHPVMRSVEPGEAWRWCFVDDQLG